MRILHLNKRYGIIGGMERYACDLVQWQRAQGHQADVLAIGNKFKGQVIRQEGGTTYLLPELFTYQNAVISHRLPDALLRLMSRYDILHFQYPFPLAELCYLMVGFRSKVPTIVTFQGEVVPAKRFSRVYDLISKLFLGRVNRIIATSPTMAETSNLLQRLREKVSVIVLGIDPPVPDGEVVDNLYPVGAFPRLLYVGRFGRYKGLPYLIEAMAQSPGHLVLVGDGPLRVSLEASCRKLGITDRVTFAGVLSDQKLANLYQEADVLILPSIDRGESFGYVVLEGMATSNALLTTELGTGTSFANVHGETGLVVEPSNPQALADAICQMASSRERLRRYGEAGYRRFVQNFTLDEMARKTEAEYISISTRRESVLV